MPPVAMPGIAGADHGGGFPGAATSVPAPFSTTTQRK
jgi:hypothetical protein